MGFRIIRENSSNYLEKIGELKKLSLEEETQRWSFLTFKDEHKKSKFLERFAKIKKNNTKSQDLDLPANILFSGANIAKIQGNLSVEHLATIFPTLLEEERPFKNSEKE